MRNGDRAGADNGAENSAQNSAQNSADASAHTGARGSARRRRPSRRTVLLGSLGVAVAGGGTAGYALVQSGVLPGKYALARLDGACGSPPAPPRGALPTTHAATFYSAYRHRVVTMVTLIPAGVSAVGRLGVVVGLHGADASARHLASQLSPAMAAARIAGLAVVTVDGGNAYWHARADGDDPVGMIRHEVLPRLARAGLSTSKVAIVGESMGGYGALLLAELLAASRQRAGRQRAGRQRAGRPRVTAVAALSPAIFGSYGDASAANRSSFDSPADFARNDVSTRAAALRSVPTWIGCGADDPFEPAASQLRARLAAVTGHAPAGGILPGCHDDAFWARNMPAALSFLARQTEEGR